MKRTYVCDQCGLCCQHLLVEAGAIDVLREPRIDVERPSGKLAPSLSILDACWILAGPDMPCPFLSADSKCGIYLSRPGTCVAFMAGSAKCQKLRAENNVPPLTPHPVDAGMLAEIQTAALADETQPV
jgi:Fe-S-cluster containining protein